MDREYATEEQELKLMLKTDNEERIEKETKNLFADWENVLFGINILAADQSHKDLDSFILIRYAFNVQIYQIYNLSKIFFNNENNYLHFSTAWDRFISSENDATTIPIGWIVPEKPSSAAWQKCLNKDTS